MQKLIFSYLKFWATGYLKRTKPEIVAITGSVGKTSAKEAIFEVLKVRFGDDVRKSTGNLNTETGVPLAVLGFDKSPNNALGWLGVLILVPFRRFTQKTVKILVLELAADKPGDIKYLTSFVKPKVAVLTAIGPSHLVKFGTMEKIIEEKTSIFKALDENGIAVINADTETCQLIYQKEAHKKKSYSVKVPADLMAEKIETKIEDFDGQTSFEIKYNGLKVPVTQKTLGNIANVSAALAAAAVGLIYEMNIDDIVHGLSMNRNEKHRMQVLKGKINTTIIDDSYNANPQSMKAALSTLKSLPSSGRKIVVLGEMKEIGHISDEEHAEIGILAKETADLVIAVGEAAKRYNAQEYFISKEDAVEFLLKNINPSDLILIKASRGIKLDEIVEKLKA